MPVELTMLAYSVALLFVIVLIQANAGVSAQGLVPMANNRDNLPPPTAFQAREARGRQSSRRAGSCSRRLQPRSRLHQHARRTALLLLQPRRARDLYILGVPLVRLLVWAVGIAGTVMVFLAIFHIA